MREVWSARDLLMQFTKRDIVIRYSQAVMGFAWALLLPLMIVGAGLVFRLVVSTLSNTSMAGNSVASLAIKALPWAFFSGSLSMATLSIIAHANLIGKIYFPRETLPIASVLAQCVDLAVSLAIVAVMLPFMGVVPSLQAVWALLALLLLAIFTIGCALLLSCANLFFRDVKYIVQIVMSFGVFATPVFFEPQMLGKKGAAIMMALPLSPFIQAIDLSVVHRHNLLEPLSMQAAGGPITVWEPWMLLYAATLSAITLVLGLRVFRRASSRFAEMA
jgi:lipopolysaccharide transport system permease protein